MTGRFQKNKMGDRFGPASHFSCHVTIRLVIVVFFIVAGVVRVNREVIDAGGTILEGFAFGQGILRPLCLLDDDSVFALVNSRVAGQSYFQVVGYAVERLAEFAYC